MKKITLYNIIFPIWFLLFLPPVIVITLVGNFIIDSLVVMACFFTFRLGNIQNSLKTFYNKSILKVWIFGFLADIIGASILILFGVVGNFMKLPNELIEAIDYDPFSHPVATAIIIFSMLISAVFIFLFN